MPISLYTLKAAGDLAFNIDNELIGSKSASGCAVAVTSVLTLAASTAGAGVSFLATVVFLAVLFFVVLLFVCASTEKTLNANSKIKIFFILMI